MARARPSPPLWLRLLIGTLALVGGLVALAFALRAWLPTDGGRALVVSLADGQRLGALGTLRIERMTGDPLDDFAIADLALVDDQDVWLRARDVRIDWTAQPILGRSLEIDRIEIREATVLHAPVVTRPARRGGRPDLAVRIGALSVETVNLSSLSPQLAQTLRAEGALRVDRAGDGEARLELNAQGDRRDGLVLRAEWTEAGSVSLELDGEGPEDGALARALMAPAGSVPGVAAQMTGEGLRLTGAGEIRFGDARALSVRLERQGKTAAASGTIDPAGWPLLRGIELRTGGAVAFVATAEPGDRETTPVRISASMPAGRIEAGAAVDLAGARIVGPIDVGVVDFDLSRLGEAHGVVSAQGVARIEGPEAWTWTGGVSVREVDIGAARAVVLEGPLTLSRAGRQVSWSAESVAARDASLPAAPGLTPQDYEISATGTYSLSRRRLDVLRGQVEGRPGRITAQGAWVLRTDAMRFTGSADLVDVSGFAPVSGAAQGQWTLSRAGRDAPYRLSLEARGRGIRSETTTLAQLLGAEPAVTAAIALHRGRIALSSGSLSGAGVEARLTGSLVGEGAVRGEWRARLRRPIDVGGVTLEAGVLSGTLAGPISAPILRASASDAAVAFGGERVWDIRGSADIDLGRSGRATWSLSGLTAEGAPARFSGAGRIRLDAARGPSPGLDISEARLAYAGLEASLSAVRLSADGASADFQARGSLEGVSALTAGEVNASGQVRLGDTLAIDARGEATGIKAGDIDLARAAFQLTLKDNQAQGQVRVRGADSALLDLVADIAGQGRARAWSGSARLQGRLAGAPVDAPNGLVWRMSAQGASLSGEVRALGGRISGEIDTESAARARLDWTGLDLAAITSLSERERITGTVSGALRFDGAGAKGSDTARGELSLVAEGLNPAGVTRDSVSLTLSSALRGEDVTLQMTGQGQGFLLSASGEARARVGRGFDVRAAMDQPMRATVSLEGAVDPLWRLFGPREQVMSGEASARVMVTGTPAQPRLEGDLALSRGRYEHAESGLRLQNIDVRGAFDQTVLRIVSLSANDRATGRLTGSGDVRWAGGVSGGVDVRAQGFQLLGREDRMAVVSGTGRLSIADRRARVSGEFSVEQARFSVEQPAAERIPTLPRVQRVNFARQADANIVSPVRPSVALDVKLAAPRRVFVFGRGLDTEWSGNVRLTGTSSAPRLTGEAQMLRGDLNLAGRRFDFESGAVRFDGAVAATRIDITARREAADIDARARVSGPLSKLTIDLTSTPELPRDEVLSRVLFSRSLAQLTPLEGAQLAAALNQLAGGQAAFDPGELLRGAARLDRLALGAGGDASAIEAGKYITRDVYLQVGAGGEGGVAAEVEWQPAEDVSIVSTARGNGDTRIALRWKKDY